MKYIPFLLLFMLITSGCLAQQVIFEQEVDTTLRIKKWGENCRHSFSFYGTYGNYYLKAEPGAKIDYPRSSSGSIGFRYKLKLLTWYALVGELQYENHKVYLKQIKTKLVPDTVLHHREYIAFYGTQFAFYQRFNFGKRGNVFGKFVDIGIYTVAVLSSRHVTFDTKNTLGSKTKTIHYNPGYIQNFDYGIAMKAGWNILSVFGRYRLSNWFKTVGGNKLPELPRLTIGLDISLFTYK